MLYSVLGDYIGRTLEARADAELVKLSYQGQLIKVRCGSPAHQSSRWCCLTGRPLAGATYLFVRGVRRSTETTVHW